MNDKEEKTTKKTSKGRHGSAKRPHRTEVYFTDREYARVQELSEEVGAASLPEFVRHIVMHRGKVTAPLTAEERKSITDLHKIGTNIWKTRNALIALMIENTELKKKIPDLQKIVDELKTIQEDFAEINEHFKEKVQK